MAFLKCWSAITVLNLTTRNSRISPQIGSSSTELQVQDIHKQMEKWKMLWRPAKDCSWKRRKTNETHYWQSSLSATPQVGDSAPHQYKGWWVGTYTPCYQLLKSNSSQTVTWSPHQCHVATMKCCTRLRMKADHQIRLRMKADHLFARACTRPVPNPTGS